MRGEEREGGGGLWMWTPSAQKMPVDPFMPAGSPTLALTFLWVLICKTPIWFMQFVDFCHKAGLGFHLLESFKCCHIIHNCTCREGYKAGLGSCTRWGGGGGKCLRNNLTILSESALIYTNHLSFELLF